MANLGRPPVLDDAKKREICALVFAGCSRTVAAHYVDCSPTTILHEQQRDPAFAERLRNAEISNEANLLHCVKEQAGRSWRAATWFLERSHPNRYGRRRPRSLAPELVCDSLRRYAVVLLDCVTCPEERKRLRARLRHMIEWFSSAANDEHAVSPRDIADHFNLSPANVLALDNGLFGDDFAELLDGSQQKTTQNVSASL